MCTVEAALHCLLANHCQVPLPHIIVYHRHSWLLQHLPGHAAAAQVPASTSAWVMQQVCTDQALAIHHDMHTVTSHDMCLLLCGVCWCSSFSAQVCRYVLL
jgi:hypothetical protein